VTGQQLLNHAHFNDSRLRSLSTYVEQDDFLVGSLTVAETVSFAAKLALPSSLAPNERAQRIEDMIRDFGLNTVKASCIGTPLKRGVSGGEKRRVTTASQLITLPKVIFLGNAPHLTTPTFTPAD
jgi:ABC-type multidrug transport system ATPase subunit